MDVKSFDRHGFPWLQSTKHIYNIDNNIYKKSTLPIVGFYRTESCKLPHPPPPTTALHVSLLVLPAQRSKANPTAAPVCVETGLKRNWTTALPPYVQWVFPLFPPKTPASARNEKFSDHERILILQLFKFFDLLSQEQYPLLTQCCLYFTDSDQGPEVFELSTVLRHTDAPHGVSLFT